VLFWVATVHAQEPSLQSRIDAAPGTIISLNGATYELDEALRIEHDGSGLIGPGHIVQRNPDASIVHVFDAADVRIEGLTLTRAEGVKDATKHGLHAERCEGFDAINVRVADNRSAAGTIFLERCRRSSVRGCDVRNYKRITVDDRTGSELYGYAFRVIDGTGILVNRGSGIILANNRVVETNISPSRETKDAYQLGQFTDGKQPLKKGPLAPPGNYANNWHQGSAIVVTGPKATDHVLITGNYIENAAQGIDIHADYVTCTQNVIDHAFIGIKCMHGSKNVIITHNSSSHNDLWGLIMQAGTASHRAEAATDDRPAREANYTAGNIIAHNIFSDYGFGHEYWNWKESRQGVISIESGPLPENPVIHDVLIQGNIVYDSGRDQVLQDGRPVTAEPRYEYAVAITADPAPTGLKFSDNIFHPGRGGVSNIPLPE
jgi:hypothetical protein